jgi:transposase
LQGRCDGAVIPRRADRLSVFVATLGWSRAAYTEFVTDERVETLIAAHENAFLSFGGVPKEDLYDNMRTVVSERNGYTTRSNERSAAPNRAGRSSVPLS